jgi:hypothetical protein
MTRGERRLVSALGQRGEIPHINQKLHSTGKSYSILCCCFTDCSSRSSRGGPTRGGPNFGGLNREAPNLRGPSRGGYGQCGNPNAGIRDQRDTGTAAEVARLTQLTEKLQRQVLEQQQEIQRLRAEMQSNRPYKGEWSSGL